MSFIKVSLLFSAALALLPDERHRRAYPTCGMMSGELRMAVGMSRRLGERIINGEEARSPIPWAVHISYPIRYFSVTCEMLINRQKANSSSSLQRWLLHGEPHLRKARTDRRSLFLSKILYLRFE